MSVTIFALLLLSFFDLGRYIPEEGKKLLLLLLVHYY